MSKTYHKADKAPKKISKTYLENAALYYLQRYATSAENLKRVLMRKVKRSCTFHGDAEADFAPLVNDLVTRYAAVGLIDDKVFAHARVVSLRRQGHSKQAIVSRLQAKGLPRVQIEAALANTDAENENPEIAAAVTFARRKKLGPWRKAPLTDPKGRQKELAALGRAGFSYEVAREALSLPSEDDI